MRAELRGGPNGGSPGAKAGERVTDPDRQNTPQEIAWAAAYDRYASLVWACIRKFNLLEADAEDIFQNTWMVAVRRNDYPPPADAIVRYLASAAHWQIRALYKRRRTERLPKDVVDACEQDGALSEQFLLDAERDQALLDCVARLRERYREVLDLLFFQGLSYQETSDVMEIQVQGVGGLRQRALRALRACLKRHEIE